MIEATIQNAIRIGIVVNVAKSSHVKIPPPTFRARKAGMRSMDENKRKLEKFSLPAASAGSGPFLIDGYYRTSQ